MSYYRIPRNNLPDIPGEVVIMGVDPGVTTGVSLLSYPRDLSDPHKPLSLGVAQLSYGKSGNKKKDHHLGQSAWVESSIAQWIGEICATLAKEKEYVFVGIEDFIPRRFDMGRDFLSPVRLAAAIRQELYPLSVGVRMQSAANAKTVCTDERMRLWGFTTMKQQDRHAKDAMRHSILLARSIHQQPRLKKSLYLRAGT